MKLKRIGAAILAACLAVALISSEALAATNISKTAFINGREYRLTNMPANHPNEAIYSYNGQSVDVKSIQNFAESPDGKYVFTSGESFVSGKPSTLLCVFNKPAESGAEVETECIDIEFLYNYGHSESMAVSQPNLGKELYYIYVGCDPIKGTGKSYTASVMRLTYDAAKKKITKKVKISGLKYCTSFKKAARTAVAVNQNCNKLCFYIVTQGCGDHYVFYDLKKLNKQLNKLKNGETYNIKKAASMKVATVKHSFYNGVYQSFDIDDKAIYICGDNRSASGAFIEKITYKTYKAGSAKAKDTQRKDKAAKTITIKSPYINLVDGYSTGAFDVKSLEYEGTCIRSSNGKNVELLCTFTIAGQAKHDSVVVHKIKF